MRIANRLTNTLRERGHKVRLLETQIDMVALRQSLASIQPQDRLIVIGGDGTLNQILNTAPRFHGLAFFGMGTANVLCREFRLPRKVTAFIAMLEADRRADLYPGLTGDGRQFAMMCSFGIDAFVLSRVDQGLKNRVGHWAFLPAALNALRCYKFPTCTFTIDGGPAVSAPFAVFSRIKRYGGPFILARDADPGQALLHVTALLVPGRRAALSFFWKVLRGKLKPARQVFMGNGRQIRIATAPSQLPWQMDGDYFSGSENLTIASQKISFIVP